MFWTVLVKWIWTKWPTEETVGREFRTRSGFKRRTLYPMFYAFRIYIYVSVFNQTSVIIFSQRVTRIKVPEMWKGFELRTFLPVDKRFPCHVERPVGPIENKSEHEWQRIFYTTVDYLTAERRSQSVRPIIWKNSPAIRRMPSSTFTLKSRLITGIHLSEDAHRGSWNIKMNIKGMKGALIW